MLLSTATEHWKREPTVPSRPAVDALRGSLDLLILKTLSLAPLLFNQSPRDPVVFGTVTATLLLVAVVASLIPAIRGARVDPNAALRAD